MMDMQMPSGHAPKCTCSHTPPEYPSQATSIDLYSPTFPTNQTSPQIVTVLDLLKSAGASTKIAREACMTRIREERKRAKKGV